MSTSVEQQRILVCGGRDYRDDKRVFEWLDSFRLRPLHDLIIEGGCRIVHHRGADYFASVYAQVRHIPLLTVWADWDEGRSAGPTRNRKMLEWKPTHVLAFPGGTGTANMKWVARAHHIPVVEVPE